MKVWITGCCGFLGSHLCEALLAAGHEVDGNDSLICGDEKNLPKGLSYTLTDCRSFEPMLANFMQFKPDVVVHCAATAAEGLSIFSPNFITKNIAEASVSTFSAAISAGVKRIVFMSSMARYGNGILPFREGNEPRPCDPYGHAKVYAENQLKTLCKEHNVKWAILVPHNILGTKQQISPYRNVATIMINRCLKGKTPIIYGDGQQVRCFSPIADVIPSVMKAINGDADFEVVNIGPDKGWITIEELADTIQLMTGCLGMPTYVDSRPGEVREAYCSSDKARHLLGYKEQQTLHECLQEMIDYIKKNGTKEFDYSYPLEIVTERTPKTWLDKLI